MHITYIYIFSDHKNMGYASGLAWVKYIKKLVSASSDHSYHLNRKPVASSPGENAITPSSDSQSSFDRFVDSSSYLYDMQCDVMQRHN